MLNPNDILKELIKAGIRVVPELLPGSKTYEIIVEPWDFQTNKKAPGRTKRTGVFFQQKDLNKKVNNVYYPKLQEIELKEIKKYESRNQQKV